MAKRWVRAKQGRQSNRFRKGFEQICETDITWLHETLANKLAPLCIPPQNTALNSKECRLSSQYMWFSLFQWENLSIISRVFLFTFLQIPFLQVNQWVKEEAWVSCYWNKRGGWNDCHRCNGRPRLIPIQPNNVSALLNLIWVGFDLRLNRVNGAGNSGRVLEGKSSQAA